MTLDLGGNKLNSTSIGPEGQALKHIVKDGLVLHLDAANLNSYPGSGSTWYDLSGRGNHFSIGANITWNSAGYFNFNGGTLTGPASNASTFGFRTTNEHYIEVYAQVTSAATNNFFNWQATPSLGSDTRAIWSHFYYSNGNTYYDVDGCCDPTQRISYANDSDFTSGVKLAAWRTRTNTTPNRQFFKNTVSVMDSGAYSTATVTWNLTTAATIGNGWLGNLYSFKLYNRALSDSEMQQNYNIERYRYAGGYYDCGYGCQYYLSNPGCASCTYIGPI